MSHPPASVGAAMWLQLEQTFLDVLEANGAHTPDQRAQIWAGFYACAAGAMRVDIGKEDAVSVLEMVIEAIEVIET